MTQESQELQAVIGRRLVVVNVKGARPDGEMHEISVSLYDVPRVGDQLSVWTGREEAYVKVSTVTWPSWGYSHLPDDAREPEIWLERDEWMSDDDWADIFEAIREGRTP